MTRIWAANGQAAGSSECGSNYRYSNQEGRCLAGYHSSLDDSATVFFSPETHCLLAGFPAVYSFDTQQTKTDRLPVAIAKPRKTSKYSLPVMTSAWSKAFFAALVVLLTARPSVGHPAASGPRLRASLINQPRPSTTSSSCQTAVAASDETLRPVVDGGGLDLSSATASATLPSADAYNGSIASEAEVAAAAAAAGNESLSVHINRRSTFESTTGSSSDLCSRSPANESPTTAQPSAVTEAKQKPEPKLEPKPKPKLRSALTTTRTATKAPTRGWISGPRPKKRAAN